MWTTLAFRNTPRGYVHIVCFTTVACLMIVVLSFIWHQMMNVALLLVSPFALAGAPLVSLGFMGCNQELSEVRQLRKDTRGWICADLSDMLVAMCHGTCWASILLPQVDMYQPTTSQ